MSNTILPSLPVLYKRTNTGATQQWQIRVEQTSEGFGLIVTEYGQVDGALMKTEDTIRRGKNEGKKNETTPITQALAEAQAKWEKQIKRQGYVEDKARAEAGETDSEGGIAPMLAKTYEDAEKHVKYPCHAQRKYNGVRCIVIIENGTATLWTRKRKPITSMPHIVAAYEAAYKGVGGEAISFDGEIYRHGWSLQKISGFVRSTDPKPGYTELSHWVYDAPLHKGCWEDRCSWLKEYVPAEVDCIRLVQTVTAEDHAYVKTLHDAWVQEGYEGAILRHVNGKYEAGKRSHFLIKVKEFKEEEFEIVDVVEGRGRFEGKAVFVCKTKEGKQFNCTAPGTMKDKEDFLRDKDQLVNKQLTVKFFDWTEDKIPQFPVGRAVRDYE